MLTPAVRSVGNEMTILWRVRQHSADGEHDNFIDTNSFGCLLGATVSQMRDGTKQGLNSDTTWTQSIHKEDLILT